MKLHEQKFELLNHHRNRSDIHAPSFLVKPVRRACARGSKFGQDASLRRARAVRAKCSLAGLTTSFPSCPKRALSFHLTRCLRTLRARLQSS